MGGKASDELSLSIAACLQGKKKWFGLPFVVGTGRVVDGSNAEWQLSSTVDIENVDDTLFIKNMAGQRRISEVTGQRRRGGGVPTKETAMVTIAKAKIWLKINLEPNGTVSFLFLHSAPLLFLGYSLKCDERGCLARLKRRGTRLSHRTHIPTLEARKIIKKKILTKIYGVY